MFNDKVKKIIKILFAVLFCLSLAFNGWLVYQLSAALDACSLQQDGQKVLAFTRMFVKDILMATKEIDFDTRLSLETAVRGLDDKQILAQWQKFAKSETKESSSQEAKVLLDLLVRKIR